MSIFSNLTIIIPTFYPGKIIKKCFASLPKKSEIIIVDNGNDSELEKIIKSSNLKIKHFKRSEGDAGYQLKQMPGIILRNTVGLFKIKISNFN